MLQPLFFMFVILPAIMYHPVSIHMGLMGVPVLLVVFFIIKKKQNHVGTV